MEKIKKYLETIDNVIEKGSYKDSWESFRDSKVPDWYKNAKLGIFIHWGIFSVPAFGSEWYSRWMYVQGNKTYEHHINTYGKQKDFGYKDFIPMFKAEKFDPAEWAELFLEAGARYVMPVAEHHDGFQMYDSDLSEWCAAKKGPQKDVLWLLSEEVRKRGMNFAASSHRVEHYWFMGNGRDFESDIADPQYGDIYWPSYSEKLFNGDQQALSGFTIEQDFKEDWLARTCEIVDKYRPQILYFDWWIQVEDMKPYLKKFLAYYYNRALEWGIEVAVNYKDDAFMFGSAVRDIERGQLADISPNFWQNDTSVAKNSWCYTVGNDYKQPNDIICDLIDVVSKNGTLLLNIGPKADGTIPDEDKHILKELGKWVKVNGEGIYDTKNWKKFGEGSTKVLEGHFTDTLRAPFQTDDIRFTYKNESIYAFSLKWPEDGILKIKLLGKKEKIFKGIIKDVCILGYGGKLSYELGDELVISAPELKSEYPVCIKVSID